MIPPLETLPPEIWVREYFTSGLFCLQRTHLVHEYFFSWGGVVSTLPNRQAGGPPFVGCPRLLIQFIRSYPPHRRPFLHLQPEDAPCHGDRDPQTLTYKVMYTLIIRCYCWGNWRWRDSESAENISFFYSNFHCFLICQVSYCKGKIMDDNEKSWVNNKTEEHTSLLVTVKVYH